MSDSGHKRWMTFAGVGLAVLYVALSIVTTIVTIPGPDSWRPGTGLTRALSFLSFLVLALGLFGLGLAARRFWQAPWAPVVVGLSSFAWLTWALEWPRWVEKFGWDLERGADITKVLNISWGITSMLAVILGWGLIRRVNWWWTAGLLPACVVVPIVWMIGRSLAPKPEDLAARDINDVLARWAHQNRIYSIEITLMTTLTVVACVWLCVLAERIFAGRESTAR